MNGSTQFIHPRWDRPTSSLQLCLQLGTASGKFLRKTLICVPHRSKTFGTHRTTKRPFQLALESSNNPVLLLKVLHSFPESLLRTRLCQTPVVPILSHPALTPALVCCVCNNFAVVRESHNAQVRPIACHSKRPGSRTQASHAKGTGRERQGYLPCEQRFERRPAKEVCHSHFPVQNRTIIGRAFFIGERPNKLYGDCERFREVRYHPPCTLLHEYPPLIRRTFDIPLRKERSEER